MWDEVKEFFTGLFESEHWQARWHHGYWSTFHGWMYIAGEFLVATAYLIIPVIILRFVAKRKIRFHRMYYLFAAFLLVCGTAHLVNGLIFWVPLFRFSALLFFCTGLVSWITVLYLFKLLPVAFGVKTREQLESEMVRNTALLKKLQGYNESLSLKNNELKLQKEFTESVLDLIMENVCVFDREMRLMTLNQSAAATFKLDKQTSTGKHFTELFGHNSPVFGDIQLAFKGIESSNDLYYSALFDRYFKTHFAPLRDAEDKVYAVLLMSHDVTETVQRQRSLAELNETFKLAEEISRSGSYKYDLYSGSLNHSDNLYQLLGLDPKKQILTPELFNEMVLEEDKQKSATLTELVLKEGEPRTMELKIKRATSEVIHVRHTGKRLRNDAGEEFIIGAIQDITEDVKKSLELQNQYNEVQLVNEELEQYVFLLSHDLQEPMRKILMFLGMLESNDCVADRHRGILDKAQSAAIRMRELMTDVLDYSQVRSESLAYRDVDLKEIAGEVQADYSLMTEEKNALVLVKDLPVVKGVRTQLHQLFSNLFSNALKFNDKRKPELKISGAVLNDGEGHEGLLSGTSYYVITFEDNGIGFDASYKEKVFEIFQRLHNNEKEYKGTGIGLSICRRVVKNHHGHITAASEPGKGTTFTVYLPVDPDEF